ncbi:ATP-binding cassette domain-containing protein [Actinomadura macra]|uniref:ATP-binding cassette domain-containing protein n=1 Tax=Actinomadura macra TaxID=46164 RepID=UPI00083128BC|nr:ATP-binding cassette domain-containing protein [Actinomadura macra]
MRIVTENLSKTYGGGVVALDHVSLDLGPGMVGLLGSNGAGKTTLMRILVGVVRPTGGRASLGGRDITDRRRRRDLQRVLGYLPQELALYPELTAQEFVEYIGLLKGLSARRRREEARRLLDLVGLAAFADRRVRGLSGGMCRRVGIAQALLGDPELLIVDEPTAGLDPEERIRFRSLLAELGGDRTVLLSTHILEDVAQTCPQLVVLDHGRVLFQGLTADLLETVRGRVFLVPADGLEPPGSLVLGTVAAAYGQAKRVVTSAPGDSAEPVPVSLEDAYAYLLHSSRTGQRAGSGIR